MFPAIEPALVTTDPALETTVPATLVAAEAELAAVSTMLVTAALRRYQITRRLMALGRLLLLLGSNADEFSESFWANGVHYALEEVTGTSSSKDEFWIGWVVFKF